MQTNYIQHITGLQIGYVTLWSYDKTLRYFYDKETGFYNLNARYYDPEIRRFISADSMSVLMIATVSLECKNLFVYSENNPITSKDSTGNVVETVFDLISLGSSIVEVIAQPNNPWNWICMIGDIADLIPCVSGLGETLKGIKASVKGLSKAKKASNAVEAGGEVAEAVSKSSAKALKTNSIPDNDSTIGHIFRDAEGHIPDTPENRTLLENVANNVENFLGKDKYGNEWYTMDLEDGSQVWVEVRNGNIFEGGINTTPKPWDSNTGLKKP